MSIWRYANPAEFMRLTERLLAPVWIAAGALLAVGIGWALFATPPDYQQGSTVKILFIHVPAAMLAINTYAIMAVASVITPAISLPNSLPIMEIFIHVILTRPSLSS